MRHGLASGYESSNNSGVRLQANDFVAHWVRMAPSPEQKTLRVSHDRMRPSAADSKEPQEPTPGLLLLPDATATLGGDGHTVYLAVVNRSQDEPVSTHIRLSGWHPTGDQAQAYELNGKSWDAFNPYGSTADVNIQQRMLEVQHAAFSYRFPAHSVTVLELQGNTTAMP